MKKVIFYLIAVIALTSCSSGAGKKFKLTGTIDDSAYNGNQVVFSMYTDNGVVKDTVEIADNKFVFKSRIERPTFTNVNLTGPAPLFFQVVIEEGNTLVSIEKKVARVSGTPMNDLLQSYNDKEAEAMKTVEAMDSDFKAKEAAGTVTDEERVEYEKTRSDFSHAFGDYRMDFIKTNIDNVVGKTFFGNTIIYLTGEERQKMLDFATDDLKEKFTTKKR